MNQRTAAKMHLTRLANATGRELVIVQRTATRHQAVSLDHGSRDALTTALSWPSLSAALELLLKEHQLTKENTA